MSGYNPYENMLNTLDVAAEKLGYSRSDYEVLRHPERELKVAVPLQLDNGEVRVYEGYRCPVSYTHLDVYKRQLYGLTSIIGA